MNWLNETLVLYNVHAWMITPQLWKVPTDVFPCHPVSLPVSNYMHIFLLLQEKSIETVYLQVIHKI